MFERPQSGERAVLVYAGPGGVPDESEREEFSELATSAGAVVVAELIASRKRPDPRYFIGKGKLDEPRGMSRSPGALARVRAARPTDVDATLVVGKYCARLWYDFRPIVRGVRVCPKRPPLL